MKPGDMALSRNDREWFARLITWFTRSRYSHVRLVVHEDGTTLEAIDKGVQWGRVRPSDVVLSPPISDEQRNMIVLLAPKYLGTPYGWLDVAVLGLAQVNIKLPYLTKKMESPKRMFCSQFVDHVWRRVGFQAFDDGREPQNVSPGDLADLALRGGWPSVLPTTNRKTSA